MIELANFHGIETKIRKVHGTVCVLIFRATNIHYILSFFSVMEQIRSGEILFFANLKKQEEKRKQKKLKKEHALLNKKIGSM